MSFATAALDLVRHFRRQRPLRAGSLIVTIFGDAIVPRGGAVALGSLIRLAAPFGLTERLVRTASARLAQEGWLQARRVGKRSEYRLSSGGRERFAEATVRIYGEPAPWSGHWSLLVLPELPAAKRQALRKELTWQGFGELASGLFAHPERPGALEAPAAGTLMFEATLADQAASGQLVRRGWDLGELAQGYRRFVRRFERAAQAARARPVAPETGFIVRTLLIHEYRKLHLRDPLLPAGLLPGQWPGIRAAALCRELYGRIFAASESHLSAVGARLAGALPPPEKQVWRRFGGLAP